MDLDSQIVLALNQGLAHPALDAFFEVISMRWAFALPLSALIAALLLARFRRDGLWLMLALLVALGCGDLLGNGLKHLLAQARPCHEMADQLRQLVPCSGRYRGMPSNHALNYWLAAGFLGWTLRRRPAVGIGLGTLAALVCLSRVYLARHYPSQVLVGALIGLAVGLGAAHVVARLPLGRRLQASLALEAPADSASTASEDAP